MNNRRKFLQTGSLVSAGFLFSKPLKTFAGITSFSRPDHKSTSNTISVLYTADLHGRVGSFNLGNLNKVGGLTNIYSTIKANSPSHLLVDGGDFLNEKQDFEDHGRMIRMMNKTGYYAATLGDKELSKGEDHLASLIPLMNFKLVNCNYEFSHPVLRNRILPFYISHYNGYRVGITGVGPRIEGIMYYHPYEKANKVTLYLKKQMNCDLVICLSHLGIEQENGQPDNKKLAALSKNIDVIISGHNNKITHPQMALRNKEKNQVIIGNAAYGGSVLGRLNFAFDEQSQMHSFTCKNFIPGEMANSSFYSAFEQLCA